METRLIIVEGLPCSGKSTTSKKIANYISSLDISNALYEEGDLNHPADYEYHAYITKDVFDRFSKNLQLKVKKESIKVLDGFVFPLKKADKEEQKTLMKYKIYDRLPWEVEKDVMLDKWERFYNSCHKDKMHIFECCMIQNPMCETVIRFDFNIDQSEKFIQSIFKKVSGLNPLLIYLKTGDVKKRIKEVSSNRDKKWLEFAISYHENGKFAKNRNLEGFSGYIECLERRQKREIKIIDKLDVNKKIIINPFLNWNETIKEIERTIDKYL